MYQRLSGAVYGSRVVAVSGRADKRGEGVSLLAAEVMVCQIDPAR